MKKTSPRSTINRHFKRESILMLLVPLIVAALSIVFVTIYMWLY